MPPTETPKEQAATDPQSTQVVDLTDDRSLREWSTALSVTPEALKSACQAVGPRIDRIKDWLTGGMAGDQEDA